MKHSLSLTGFARGRQPAAASQRTPRLPLLRPLALALAAGSLLTPLPGLSNPPVLPAGLSVAQGTATLTSTGGQMTVTNSSQAVLNWQSFSIGAGQSVRFQQPDAASKVLNRVLGADPSNILGSLTSNGTVWLLNPHGVLFGAGARVDVAGLVVSTLNIADADWKTRRYSLLPFGGGAPAGAAIVNQGELRSTSGGRVLLLGAGAVRNEGLIEAVDGQVMLAAGQSVDLADSGTPHIALRLTAPAGQALNLGRIESGRDDLQAALVNHQGNVRAQGLGGSGGTIVLHATQQLDLAAGSQTLADAGGAGAAAGRIVVDGGPSGTAMLSGLVSASSADGLGGRVDLLGHHVGVLDGATLRASGASGGGEIRVGGGLQGRDASVRNADAVFIGPQARVEADATGQGDGGRLIVWSDLATRAYGHLSARGGPLGGDGGFIETSGGWLDARPASVSAAAPLGRAGQWLLDPNDMHVGDEVVEQNVSPGPAFTTTNDAARIRTGRIVDVLNAGTNVSLTTTSSGANAEGGDIYITNAMLSAAPPSAVSLSFFAARNILMSGSKIESTGAPMAVKLSPAGGGQGVVHISDSMISSRGGPIDIGGRGQACLGESCAPFLGAVGYDAAAGSADRGAAVRIFDSTLDAAGGDLALLGASTARLSDAYGVFVFGSMLSGRNIDVQGWTHADSSFSKIGVMLQQSSLSASSTLTIEGQARSETFHQSTSVDGVNIQADTTLSVQPPVADTSARLQIRGSAGDGPGVLGAGGRVVRHGVYVTGPATFNVANGATLEIAGEVYTGFDDRSIGASQLTINASTASSIEISSGGGDIHGVGAVHELSLQDSP